MQDPAGLPSQSEATRPRSLVSTVGKLAASNGVLLLAGLVTGPMLARGLGPSGRGDLVAIAAPLALAPVLFSVGLGTYASWAVARGRDVGAVVGTTGALLLGLGALGAVAGVLASPFFADGRSTVSLFLEIGFLMLPFSLIGLLCLDIAIGLQDWRIVIASKLTTVALTFIPITVLFAFDALDVTNVAIVTLAASVALVIAIASVVRRRPTIRFRRAITREALPFGTRAWVGGLSSVANTRADQLVMIRLVSAEQLGLYVVAVTLSSFFVGPLINAVTVGLQSRVARGEHELVRRTCRTLIVVVGAIAAVTAVASYPLLWLVFGHPFVAAWPMTLILLLGSIPLALNAVLSSGISSAGRPGIPSKAEVLALGVTVPGLLLVLGTFEATGAAVVSVVSYSLTTLYLAMAARDVIGGGARDYLVPTAADVTEARAVVVRLIRGIKVGTRKRDGAADGEATGPR